MAEPYVRESRVLYLDILRVFSIFCMMFLHVAVWGVKRFPIGSMHWHVFNGYESLVRFCVPVFIMISGVFFLDGSREYPLDKLFKHNILRIVTAFIFWSACYAFVVTLVMENSMDFRTILRAFVEGRYHLWFLYTLVGLYLATPILRKICQNKKLEEYFLVLFFCTLCYNMAASFPDLPVVRSSLGQMNLQIAAGYCGYFVLGHYLTTYPISARAEKTVYALGGLSVLTTALGTYWLSLRAHSVDQLLYGNLLPNTFFAATAVFVFFQKKVSRWAPPERAMRTIQLLSKVSFGMYLVHDFVNLGCKFVGLTPALFHPVLSVPLVTGLVFGASFVAAFLLSKVPVLNKYIL